MKLYNVKLKSASPMAQGRYVSEPKLDKELDKDFEQRTWRKKLHTDIDGMILLPPNSVKLCLVDVAKYLSIKIPGQSKKTYTAKFVSGVQSRTFRTNVHEDEVKPLTILVPSDGKTGGTKRVPKTFPQIDSWEATGQIIVTDEIITEDVLRQHLEEAGKFIGIGSLRVARNGWFGMFTVTELSETDE